ncbi:MAG: fumarylacetoacetate hydrolase family protein [Gemmatimonadetes bacterium]|jgi:2,4-didehydro-3-deoxy-L-rhamnonate hydrolase|nr:fumarylacetoacetate hydrolase family protein [Gemmatimonadota bacterium]MBT7863837.1 fumarylacetoacetate hydrolase family protein [Gemmatimonadota bacterium]
MKLSTFVFKGEERIGAVIARDKILIDLAAVEKTAARREKRSRNEFYSTMMDFIEAGAKAMAAARKLVKEVEESLGDELKVDGKSTHLVAKLKLRAPMPNPRKLFCLAGNYQDHIEEGGGRMTAQDKETPRVFMKPPTTTVIGTDDKILIPPVAQAVDWEGELAVVIGRKGKAIAAKDALKHVAGYTVMNDVSERQLEIKKRSSSRPKDEWFDWLNGKWLDTSAPQGPWIVTTDEIKNPQDLDISTFINGSRKQHNNTGQMLYYVADIIEYISAIITLEPGDIISTGTISGVGATTGTFLKDGDRVEIEISKIGVLKNDVAASKK